MKYKIFIDEQGCHCLSEIHTELPIPQLAALFIAIPDNSEEFLNYYIEEIDKVLEGIKIDTYIGNDFVDAIVHVDITIISSAFPDVDPSVDTIDTKDLREIIYEYRERFREIKAKK